MSSAPFLFRKDLFSILILLLLIIALPISVLVISSESRLKSRAGDNFTMKITDPDQENGGDMDQTDSKAVKLKFDTSHRQLHKLEVENVDTGSGGSTKKTITDPVEINQAFEDNSGIAWDLVALPSGTNKAPRTVRAKLTFTRATEQEDDTIENTIELIRPGTLSPTATASATPTATTSATPTSTVSATPTTRVSPTGSGPSPTPGSQSHLECIDNSCASISGSGQNTCTSKTTSCTNNSSGTPSVDFKLTVETACAAKTFSIKAKETGSSTVQDLTQVTASPSASKRAVPTLTIGKTYSFLAEGDIYISKKTAALLVGGNTTVDFGKLKAGDVSPKEKGDGVINSADIKGLIEAIKIIKNQDLHYDLNCDKQVEVIDYSLLIKNLLATADSL